jgi:CopG family transcriptional regulator, nickel-responsive regulator
MKKTVRFAVSLDHHLLDDLDRVLVQKKYETRSEAIRDLIRDHLVAENWDKKKEAVGTITIVYDHHIHDLTEKLTDIQHDFHKLILSTMHVHLDHDHCIEVLVVKGKGRDVRTVADSLISTKGVKHGKLTMTTTGKELA